MTEPIKSCPDGMVWIPRTDRESAPTFCIDQYEFTHADYWRVISEWSDKVLKNADNCRETPISIAARSGREAQKLCGLDVTAVPPYLPRSPSGFNRLEQPLISVTLREAKALCEVQGKVLPTREQWRLAASSNNQCGFATRGCDQIDFNDAHWDMSGDWSYINRFAFRATFLDISIGELMDKYHPVSTAAVGSYAPSLLGIYDMSGNAWEWTAEGSINGGAWDNYNSNDLRVGASIMINPADQATSVGFRCVAPSRDLTVKK